MTYPRDFDEFDSARLEDWAWLEHVSAAGNWGDLGRGWVDEVKTRHAERILELTEVIKRDAEWVAMARRVRGASVAPSGLVAGVKQPPDGHAHADADLCSDHRSSHEGLSRRSDHEARQVRKMAAAMATLRKLVELTPPHKSAIFHPPLAVDGDLPTALAAAAELLNVKASPCKGDTSEPTPARPPISPDRETHSIGTQYEDEPSGSTSHIVVPAQHIPVGNVPDHAPGASLPTLVIPKVSLRTPDGQYVWNGHQRIMVDGVERAVCIDLAVSLRDLPLGSPDEEPESPPLEHALPPEVEAPVKERVHVEAPAKEQVQVEAPAKQRTHFVPAEIETPVTRMKRKLNGTASRENGKRVRIAS